MKLKKIDTMSIAYYVDGETVYEHSRWKQVGTELACTCGVFTSSRAPCEHIIAVIEEMTKSQDQPTFDEMLDAWLKEEHFIEK